MHFSNFIASLSVLLVVTPGLVTANSKFTKQVVAAVHEMRNSIDNELQGQLVKPMGYPLTLGTLDKPLQAAELPRESPGLAINRLLSYRTSIRETVEKISKTMSDFRDSIDEGQAQKVFKVTREDKAWINMYLNMYMSKNHDLKGFGNKKMSLLINPGIFYREFDEKVASDSLMKWCNDAVESYNYWKNKVKADNIHDKAYSGNPTDEQFEWSDAEDRYWLAKQRLNQCRMKVKAFADVKIEVGPGGTLRD